MSNASARIVDIAGVAGDHMKVEMKNCLSRCSAEIEADVETVGRILSPNRCYRLINSRPSPCLHYVCQVIPGGHMASRNDNNVAGTHRKCVPDSGSMNT